MSRCMGHDLIMKHLNKGTSCGPFVSELEVLTLGAIVFAIKPPCYFLYHLINAQCT
jgi:hypothetical protein